MAQPLRLNDPFATLFVAMASGVAFGMSILVLTTDVYVYLGRHDY